MTPQASPIDLTLKEGELDMSARQRLEIAKPQQERSNPSFYERIKMAVQKTTNSSIHTSPAVIGLLITIAIQFGATIWWASGMNGKMEEKEKEVIELKGEVKTLKVWIDNTREQFIKMQAQVENLQREKQLENLLEERERNGK